MNNRILVERLSEDNIDDYKNNIIKLLQYSYKVSFTNYTLEQQYFINKVNDLGYFLKNDQAVSFLAIINNEIAGFIWAYQREFLKEIRLHINHFVIDENFQGFGLGRELNQSVENYAKDNDIQFIDLMVTSQSPSVNFYKHLDYQVERLQMIKKV